MLMTQYQYKIVQSDTNVVITLNHLSDPTKHKVFRFAGCYSVSGLDNHMQSLTDDQCDGFFPRRNK